MHQTKSTTLDFKTNIWVARVVRYLYPIPVYIIVNSLVASRQKRNSNFSISLARDAHNSSQLSNKGHQSLMRGKRKLIFRVQWVITLLIIISLIPELNWVKYLSNPCLMITPGPRIALSRILALAI